MPITPSAYALTTVEAVKQLGALDPIDPAPNQLLQRFINTASRMMIGYAGREFAPATSNVTRSFAASRSTVRLSPYDLRAATAVVSTTGGVTPTSTTLTLDDYTLEPVGASTYTTICLKSWWPARGRVVSVTGDWGFASVPEEVADICADQVLSWYRLGQQARTGVALVEAESPAAPAMPVMRLSAVTKDALAACGYRIPVVA